MKKIALLAAAAFAASGWAQPAKEPAKPAAQEAPKAEVKPEAAKPEAAKPEAAKPEPQKRVAKKANPRRQEDARHCLEKSTNTEVIKCAEAYL
jgi:hypothetical protein